MTHVRRVHLHSDCYWFGGSEHTMVRVAEILVSEGVQVSLSYRPSVRYDCGLRVSLPTSVRTTALRLPDSVALTDRLRAGLPLGRVPQWVAGVGMVLHWGCLGLDTLRLLLELRRSRPDVVHINNGGYPGAESAQAAVFAARLARVPVTVYVVNNLAFGYEQRWRRLDRPLDRAVARRVDQFVTGSQAAAEVLCEVLELGPGRVTVIPNTTLEREFKPASGASLRDEWDISDDAIVISVVAILEERKGHRHLLAALSSVASAFLGMEVVVLLAGEGPEEPSLRRQAAAMAHTARVIFLGPVSDPGPVLSAADVVVLPSIGQEDFPIVVLEAMAAGRAVVASRVAGTPEQIVDGVTGLLVPPGDERAMAAAIQALAHDPALRRAMGEAGRARYEAEFTPAQAARRYGALYDALSAPQQPSPRRDLSDAPLVSVIIPCFNQGRYLSEAIESALTQTHAPLEVVIVDDGSTDSTPAVSKSYGDRVRYLAKTNGGLSSARNAGARVARGELIVFLDADDVLEPTFVEESLARLRDTPEASFAYTQLRLFGREDRVTSFPDYDPALLKYDNYINATALLYAEVLEDFSYAEDLRSGWEDWDFYLTLAEHGHSGVLLDKPLVNYRRSLAHSSMSDQVDQDPARLIRRMRLLRRHPQIVPPSMQVWLLVRQILLGGTNRLLAASGLKPLPQRVPR